jgi:hypothetical protein
MEPLGAIDTYKLFLAQYNKYRNPPAHHEIIYENNCYYIRKGTFYQLLENDPMFLAIVASILCRSNMKKNVERLNEYADHHTRRVIDLDARLNAVEELLDHDTIYIEKARKRVHFSLPSFK